MADDDKSLLGCSCRVEGLVSIDERGQMVLPKDVREKVGIKAGDKLVVVTWEVSGAIRAVSLIRAESLEAAIREILGPMTKDLSAAPLGLL